MRGMRKISAQLFAVIGSCVITMAGAQGLVDPTRPPGALFAAADAGAATSGPVLQSVRLSAERKVAMISGEMVVLGGRYGTARLVRLTESEAVLKDGAETTVLRLYPLVVKRVAGGAKSASGKKNTAKP